MFDWDDLRYLIAVSRAGTLAAAARELGVQHTTVARRVAALEEGLGVPLIVKGGERIALTDAGRDILTHAQAMKGIADSIQRGAKSSEEHIAGVVRVTLPETLAGYLVRHLPELRARHAELIVNVLADVRPYDLLGGEADIAVRLHPKGEGDLVERKLGVVAWSIYASSSYIRERGRPEQLADYARHDLIGFEGALAASPGGAWFREHLPDAKFTMRGNGLLSIFNATLLGVGVTLLPCFMADPEPTLERLTTAAFSNRRIRVLVPADLARVPRVRAVFDFLAETFTRDETLFAGTSRV